MIFDNQGLGHIYAILYLTVEKSNSKSFPYTKIVLLLKVTAHTGLGGSKVNFDVMFSSGNKAFVPAYIHRKPYFIPPYRASCCQLANFDCHTPVGSNDDRNPYTKCHFFALRTFEIKRLSFCYTLSKY